jgi:hypothetical protein
VSTHTGAGKGLFTTTAFKRNQLITEYHGKIIPYKTACRLVALNKASHIRALEFGFRAIKASTKPKLGKGGAAFANDARSKAKNNAKFYTV